MKFDDNVADVTAGVTSIKANCINTPAYMDVCKIQGYYFTNSPLNGSQPFSRETSLLFSAKSFRSKPGGDVFVHSAVGSNGTFTERAANDDFSRIGKNESNQLTDFEKSRMLGRIGAIQAWIIQLDQFCFRYLAMISEMRNCYGHLHVSPKKFTELEFYKEVPLFRVDEAFDEQFTKHLCSLFGDAEIERDRSTKKKYLDGDYRRWRINTPPRLGKGVRCYVKCYEKGDVVRIEIRFENVRIQQYDRPSDAVLASKFIEAAIKATAQKLAEVATELLEKIYEVIQDQIPPFDRALFINALKTKKRRNIMANLKYQLLIESLAKKGSYTPSRLPKELRLEFRTLQDLSDHVFGIMEKGMSPGGNGQFRQFYKLRSDWEQRARALIGGGSRLAEQQDVSAEEEVFIQ